MDHGCLRALVLSLGLLALLLSPVGWAVLANRVLTGAAYSLGTTAFFTLVVESAPPGRHGEVQGYVALGITLGVGLGPAAAVALYQGFSPGALPAERLTAVAIGAVAVALSSGVCFSAASSAFRALGRAHPYALRTNFRREGLLPAFLNTMGPGADLAQLVGPWGLGLAAGTWGFGGALVAAGVVPLTGAVVYLAQAHSNPPSPSADAADGFGFDPSNSLWQDRRDMKGDSPRT